MKKISPRTVDEYIARQDKAFVPALQELRSIIKSVVPEAEEVISYQVACFKYIYLLLGMGVTRKYISIYPMSRRLLNEMKEEWDGVRISGTTLHFFPDEKLPVRLIKRLVRARVKENKARALQRNHRAVSAGRTK